MVAPDKTIESTDIEGLRGLIERIELLERKRATLAAEDRKFEAEIQAAGYDSKIIERIVRLRRSENSKSADHEHFLDLFNQAVSINILESWFSKGYRDQVQSKRSGVLAPSKGTPSRANRRCGVPGAFVPIGRSYRRERPYRWDRRILEKIPYVE